jgi:hypothetical protein
VNNNFAREQVRGNTVEAGAKFNEHTMREIARSDSDFLPIETMLEFDMDPVILENAGPNSNGWVASASSSPPCKPECVPEEN